MRTILIGIVVACLSGAALAQPQRLPRQTNVKRETLSPGAKSLRRSLGVVVASPRLVTGATRRRSGASLQHIRSGNVTKTPLELATKRRVTEVAGQSRALLPLPTSAYAPQSINFGDLKVKQAVRASITVVCPSDGEVSARYTDKFSQSRIASLSVFGGDWSSDDPAQATPVLLRTSQSGKITVQAGQEVRVELEFLSTQTGRIDGAVELIGPDWRARVPTTAAVSLLGPLAGALALPAERGLSGIVGTVLEVPIKLLSLSPGAVTVRLTPDLLPTGVTAEPFSMPLGPGQTLSGNLRLRLSENAPECLEAPLHFTLDTGGPVKGQVALSLNLYQPWREFTFSRPGADYANFSGVVQIKADGTWNLEAVGTNFGGSQLSLSFVFKEGRAQGPVYIETVKGENYFLVRRSGTSVWLKEHFGDAIRGGIDVSLSQE